MDEEAQFGVAGERVASLAGALLDDEALHDLLQQLTVVARHTVPVSQSVSITVADNGGFRTSNSTGTDAVAIDEVQYRENDGPCLEAMRSRHQLQVGADDLQGRWPEVEAAARQLGVTGVLSTPLLRAPDDAVGALNIYAREGGSFAPTDTHTAELIGQVATMLVDRALALMHSNRLNDQLREAVATREIIGAAKGILMESQTCTRDEAFDILRRASQRENRKLRDLADELVLRVEARAAGKGPRR